GVREMVRGGSARVDLKQAPDGDEPTLTFTVPARLKCTGMETRLLINGPGGGTRRQPDHSLYRLLARAYRYHDMVMRNGGKTMRELAAEARAGRSYFTRLLRLRLPAPPVSTAIPRDPHPLA